MKIGFYCFYQFYNNNRMFIDCSSPIGDDLMYPYVFLGAYLTSKGHQVSTIDTEPLESYDAIVFLDYPTKFNKYFRKLLSMSDAPTLYLAIWEPKMLRPDNWLKKNHQFFKKIFTWNTNYVDNTRYIYLPVPNKIERDLAYFDPQRKTKFCTLIASNKFSNYQGELYSERVNIICWFEKNHPNKFDLYGVDWDRLYIPFLGRLNFIISTIYRVFPILPKYTIYKSYKGRVSSKRKVLSQYRFAICFENVSEPGYITEKIFDCFMAGSIPIYWGASEVLAGFPENTFIDVCRFDSYEDLYQYLDCMSEQEYQGYLDAIYTFLGSSEIYSWSAENFASTIEGAIAND